MNAGFYKDALFGGMTNNGFKFGTALTLGWFWMRTAGCSVLYRGPKLSEVDFAQALCVSPAEADEITVPDFLQHAANETHFYIVRKINCCGEQEKTCSAAAVVTLDADGNLIQAQPNKVFAPGAQLTAGPRAKIAWYYCPLNQKSKPAYFEIYSDNATGQIDYENPLATINYIGRRYYCWLSDNLSAGQYNFAVRTFNKAGLCEQTPATVSLEITNCSPDSVDILSIETI